MFRKRSEHHAGRIKFGFCDRFRETSFRTGTHVGAFSNHRGETTSRDSWGKRSGLRIEPGESKSREGRFQEKIFARVFVVSASCQTDRDSVSAGYFAVFRDCRATRSERAFARDLSFRGRRCERNQRVRFTATPRLENRRVTRASVSVVCFFQRQTKGLRDVRERASLTSPPTTPLSTASA